MCNYDDSNDIYYHAVDGVDENAGYQCYMDDMEAFDNRFESDDYWDDSETF